MSFASTPIHPDDEPVSFLHPNDLDELSDLFQQVDSELALDHNTTEGRIAALVKEQVPVTLVTQVAGIKHTVGGNLEDLRSTVIVFIQFQNGTTLKADGCVLGNPRRLADFVRQARAGTIDRVVLDKAYQDNSWYVRFRAGHTWVVLRPMNVECE